MDRKKILIIGAGPLSFQIIQMLALRSNFQIFVASRDLEKTTRLCNLVALTLLQLDSSASVTALQVDLADIYRTADILLKLRPNIIVNCTSLLPWRVTKRLPTAGDDDLELAHRGPWLPMHLAPAYDLMRAVKLSGIRTLTVNAAFPDAVNAVLDKVGLAPVIGVGHVANRVPTVRLAIAKMARCTPAEVEVKLIGRHYFTHHVPRTAMPCDSSYKLFYRIGGVECSGQFSDSQIFYSASRDFRHAQGMLAQALTAASAATVINNILLDNEIETHAPGPNGLPGGYPVRVGQGQVVLSLPHGISRNDAITVNHNCQNQDGIRSINADASVTFEVQSMSIMESLLGFSMPTMKLQDVHQWAGELGRKYNVYADHAKRACCR
jgi:hypothetical protein